MTRSVLAAAAVLSVFLFPYPLTLLLSFLASLYLTPVALVVGILADLVYFAPGAAPVPFMSLLGGGLSVLALLVRRFVKARIMSV